jgi:hypothetical protein
MRPTFRFLNGVDHVFGNSYLGILRADHPTCAQIAPARKKKKIDLFESGSRGILGHGIEQITHRRAQANTGL